jgi:hypothetical protein
MISRCAWGWAGGPTSERRRIERFDAEAHRAEPGRVEPLQQIAVESIEPRLKT